MALNRSGIYGPKARSHAWNNNQFPLRGSGRRSIEPGVYDYFQAEWKADGAETLTETFCDYATHLMRRQVREAGCRNFYYDISFVRVYQNLSAGIGYRLPDGRIQPEGGCDELRRWNMRTYAMMQEEGIFPTGINAHATNAFSLKSMTFMDANLDSEFPMKDPMNVFPSDRMIAFSCPHNFGVGINHLGQMNRHWAVMHDATVSGAGAHRGPFDSAQWQHWGIARGDVEFIPYWRNDHVVRRIGPGLIASMWKRPGTMIIGVVNHGPDPKGHEKTRPLELTLNLQALGVGPDLDGRRLRIREFLAEQKAPARYLSHYKWFEETDGVRKPAQLQIDGRTGAVTGMEIYYHDTRYVRLDWENRPVAEAGWKNLAPEALHTELLEWGIHDRQTERLTGDGLAANVQHPDGPFKVDAWRRPGSVLLRIENPSNQDELGFIDLALEKLGVEVTHKWEQFTQIYHLGSTGRGIRDVRSVVWSSRENAESARWQTGSIRFDGQMGLVGARLDAGAVHFVSVDTYPVLE
jgi:hypothetical protein